MQIRHDRADVSRGATSATPKNRPLSLLVALIGIAILSACGSAGLSQHHTNAQVFEAEALVTTAGDAFAQRDDADASGEVALTAGPTQAAAGEPVLGELPFEVGANAAGGYVIHLRARAPDGASRTVTLGFDGVTKDLPFTGTGAYGWLASEAAPLDPGSHTLTVAAPQEDMRYDLFVVAPEHLSEVQLETFGSFAPAEPNDPDTPAVPADPDTPAAPADPGAPPPTDAGPGEPDPDVPTTPSKGSFAPRDAVLFGATLEWSVDVPDVKGNPFDLRATATFKNAATRTSIRTDLYYDGNDTYRFRFAPTEIGRWSFELDSENSALDGLVGIVDVKTNPDDGARGFYQAEDGMIAVPVGNEGHLQGVPYQVYMRGNGALESIDRLPTGPKRLSKALDDALDEAEEAGFNAVFVGVWDNWFSLGDKTWKDHDSVNPDPATFRLLETLIKRAHARDMGVHIWSWGDEQLRTTQIGVKGGIGGSADRRLQRYIAARLGPIPGWTMAYGFDLHEWVKPSQVAAWEDLINGRSGWPHLLTARQQGLRDRNFFFSDNPLPWVSNDIRTDPGGLQPYEDALEALDEAGGKPVLFERRFLYGRDSVWTMDATRRAMWQFTMAGGAASVWGIGWDDPSPYNKPGQLRSFQTFWHDRLDVDMRPDKASDGTLLLVSRKGDRVVAYKEGTSSLRLPVKGGGRAVAIDTRAGSYREIPLDPPGDGGTWTWNAPDRSDWAVAYVAR